MKTLQTAVLLLCMTLTSVGHASNLLFRIVGEAGEAIQADVWVNAKHNGTSLAGELTIDPGASTHLRMRVEASGYYPSFHTFAVADWRDRQIPAIGLVARKEHRSLLLFGGDSMFARRYFEPLPGDDALADRDSIAGDVDGLLRLMHPYFSMADIASINLETPIFRQTNPPQPLPKSVTFSADPDLLLGLSRLGVDYVALGNNHIYDYGEWGLKRTLSALNNAGLVYSGAGVLEEDARRAAQVSNWSWLSYVGWPGTARAHQVATHQKGGAALGLELNMTKDIAAQNRPTVVQYHGGLEYVERPTLTERTRFRAAIDAGADVVVGHHPHVLQGLQLHQNRLLAYSIGNFLFDQYIYSTHLSVLLYVWMDGEVFHRAELVPIYINGYQPTPATGQIRFDILQRMSNLSDRRNLDFSLSGSHLRVQAPKEKHPQEQQQPKPGTDSLQVTPADQDGYPLALFKRHNPARLLGSVSAAEGTQVRLGVDLIKRGSFAHWGEYDTQPQIWLASRAVSYDALPDPHLRVVGAGVTGLRTFERQFTRASPATLSFQVSGQESDAIQPRSECTATVSALLQSRDMRQSRVDALQNGRKMTIGQLTLGPGERQNVHHDFLLPRLPTKGVRVLINVQQSPQCILRLDDVVLVEWRTPWMMSNQPFEELSQATHLQLRR